MLHLSTSSGTPNRRIGGGWRPACTPICCAARPSACSCAYSTCRVACKISVFGGVCLEGAHPSVVETLAEDLQPSNPSLEVLRTSVKPVKLAKHEYKHGFNSFHEVRPQFVFLKLVYALVGVSQTLPFNERCVYAGLRNQSCFVKAWCPLFLLSMLLRITNHRLHLRKQTMRFFCRMMALPSG